MNQTRIRFAFLLAVVLLTAALSHAVAPAVDLTVDATQVRQKVIHAHMQMPVVPGPLTLYYPKWIPGLHEPAGPIANLTGLKFTAGGKTLSWQRDLLDVFIFHVDIPAGIRQLEVSLDYLEPTSGGGPAAGSATDKLMVFNWNQALLYPAGTPMSQLTFRPTLRLPEGWKFGTALTVARQAGAEVSFEPVSLERLVDSPLIAGQYFRAVDVTPPGEPIHHEINFVAESEADLAISPEMQRGMRRVVAESDKLFGARHYRAYRFLVALSDHMEHFGIEHHESSENRLDERTLLSPSGARGMGGLLAHEFAHSWSGKFRRPVNMAPLDYQSPLQTDLLWVYEGTTTYLGNLLAVRAGLMKADEYPQHLANTAADMGPGSPGRSWRPLIDTASAVPGMFRGGGFGGWRRGSDYYPEGDLLWFEVSTIIQAESQGRKSLEDVLRAFYGGENRGPEVKTYTARDVFAGLNEVLPYDWPRFFHEKLDQPSTDIPVGGIERSGWRLRWQEDSADDRSKPVDLKYTVGLSVGRDGNVYDVVYGGPAFRAGIAPGMKIAAVDGRVYRPEYLSEAILAAKGKTEPIPLLVIADDYYRPIAIDYHEGAKAPRLVRNTDQPDMLNVILKPLAKDE